MSHLGQGLAPPMSHGQALVLLAIAIAMSATIALLMWADHRRADHRRPGSRPPGDTAPDRDTVPDRGMRRR